MKRISITFWVQYTSKPYVSVLKWLLQCVNCIQQIHLWFLLAVTERYSNDLNGSTNIYLQRKRDINAIAIAETEQKQNQSVRVIYEQTNTKQKVKRTSHIFIDNSKIYIEKK